MTKYSMLTDADNSEHPRYLLNKFGVAKTHKLIFYSVCRCRVCDNMLFIFFSCDSSSWAAWGRIVTQTKSVEICFVSWFVGFTEIY